MSAQIALTVEPAEGASGSGDSDFPLSVDQLAKLVDPKSPELLKQYGGLDGVTKYLRTDLRTGLPAMLEKDPYGVKRIEKYGRNILPPAPKDSFFEIVWGALQDKVLLLLIAAAIVSIILGSIPATSDNPKQGWFEGVAILVAVVIVVSVTSGNDFQKQKQFEKLDAKKNDRMVNSIRDGEQVQISIFDVRVGDIILLETGDVVCGDGIFLDGHSLRADESSMTGESDPIKKGHMEDGFDPFFISGSQILEGVGKMLVIAVGMNSFNGRTMMALRVPEEDTPLQIKLEGLATTIGYFGLAAAGLLLLIGIPKYFIQAAVSKELYEPGFKKQIGPDIVRLVIQAITIVVVAVPEGLPLAVTIALAYGMIKMLSDNNLVRHLAACETMGGATNICSDKTGTLTQNIMTVVTGWFGGRNYGEINEQLKGDLPPPFLDLMCTGISLNSNAFESVNEKGNKVLVGSKTECAMLGFGRVMGYEFQHIRNTNPTQALFPFSSAKKRMSTVIKTPEGYSRMFTKGASEIIVEMCDRIVMVEGGRAEVREITPAMREHLHETIVSFAKDALRTIAMAYVDVQRETDWKEEPTEPMVLIGIVGIKDPLRPEVPEAVATCQRAGITVRMVTGDNIITAENIARSCGILRPGGICMEGPKFRALSIEEMDRIIPRLHVLARSSPTDKQLLVGRLKALGEVVAVTGDGTNDAPALKMADIGFSMGICGTEVAKAASAIILLDDNFASIVKAALWGRNIFDAIRKFIQFQLTVNVVAVTIAFIGTLSDSKAESPLTAVQLLWVNLIMDSLAALALATEVPTPELLLRKPHGRNANLITRTMWRNVIGHSIYQLIVMFVLLYAGYEIFNGTFQRYDTRHYTIIFNTFVFMQLFNELNARILGNAINPFSKILSNRFFGGVMIATIGVQILFVEVGGDFTSTTRLNWWEWFICVGLGLLELPVGVFLRVCVPVKDDENPSVTLPEITDEEAAAISGSTELLIAGQPSTSSHRHSFGQGAVRVHGPTHRRRWSLVRDAVTQIGVLTAFRRMKEYKNSGL